MNPIRRVWLKEHVKMSHIEEGGIILPAAIAALIREIRAKEIHVLIGQSGPPPFKPEEGVRVLDLDNRLWIGQQGNWLEESDTSLVVEAR